MKKLEFYPKNIEEESAIISLAHWIADLEYMRERYPDPDAETLHEIEKTKKTICLCFDECDRLGIPFWFQNSIIATYEKWRTLYEKDIYTAIQEINARYSR